MRLKVPDCGTANTETSVGTVRDVDVDLLPTAFYFKKQMQSHKLLSKSDPTFNY